MNDEQKKTYIAWLADAHAMELGLVKVLEKQVEETTEMPRAQKKIEEHLAKTKQHAELVEECLKHLGSDASAGKDWLSEAGAVMQGFGSSLPQDAMVKNVHASYAAEHFEIATYTLLEAAAKEFEDEDAAQTFRKIIKDEQEMADWLLKELPVITMEHLEELE